MLNPPVMQCPRWKCCRLRPQTGYPGHVLSTAHLKNNRVLIQYSNHDNVWRKSQCNYLTLNPTWCNVERESLPRIRRAFNPTALAYPRYDVTGCSTLPSSTTSTALFHAPVTANCTRATEIPLYCQIRQYVSKSASTPRQWAREQRRDGAVDSHMPGYPQVQREVRPAGFSISANQNPGRQDHPRWQ